MASIYNNIEQPAPAADPRLNPCLLLPLLLLLLLHAKTILILPKLAFPLLHWFCQKQKQRY